MPPLAPTAAAQGDDDAGYSTQQRTRPQTVGYALTDSPTGLAAWIGEKLDAWTDPRTPIPEDRVLDTLMLYWLPRTAASSARLYWESLGDVTRWLEGPLEDSDVVDAPAGCTIFPHELQRPTRDEAAKRFTTSATGASPRARALPRARAAERRRRARSLFALIANDPTNAFGHVLRERGEREERRRVSLRRVGEATVPSSACTR